MRDFDLARVSLLVIMEKSLPRASGEAKQLQVAPRIENRDDRALDRKEKVKVRRLN